MLWTVRIVTVVSAAFGPGVVAPYMWQAGYQWQAIVCLVCAVGMTRISATMGE